MFASPLHPLHLPLPIKRLEVVTRGSGHFLEETAPVSARVGLELLFQRHGMCRWRKPLHRAPQEGDTGFGGAGCENRVGGRVIFTSNSDIFL